MKLLLVEDDPDLSQRSSSILRREGFLVDAVDSLNDALSTIAIFCYDLILLDRNLPDGDGLSFLKSLRNKRDHTPVIILSAARHTVPDRIEGLDVGADDYLSKPVEEGELVARVRTLLRRPREIAASTVEIGNLSFEIESRALQIGGQPVKVARRELIILESLVRNTGRVVSRGQIEQNSYGFDEVVSINAIDVAIHRLRQILKRHGATVVLHTVRGLGYVLEEKDDALN